VLSASVVSFLLLKIEHLPTALVYGLVILLVFGEAALFIGFVLPGETAVIVAGVAASQGHVNVGLLCLLVVISAIAGDSVGYAVGKSYGASLLKLPIVRDRRASIERALDGLAKRGPVYVFVGRFTAFLRAVMPGLAGMSKMRYRRFFVANALGGALWGVGYTLLGYFAGSALSKIENYASWFGVAVLVLAIGLLVIWHFAKKRAERSREAAWEIAHPEDGSEQRAE
jgi:membrane protein DedA with SNARE-associated domain